MLIILIRGLLTSRLGKRADHSWKKRLRVHTTHYSRYAAYTCMHPTEQTTGAWSTWSDPDTSAAYRTTQPWCRYRDTRFARGWITSTVTHETASCRTEYRAVAERCAAITAGSAPSNGSSDECGRQRANHSTDSSTSLLVILIFRYTKTSRNAWGF